MSVRRLAICTVLFITAAVATEGVSEEFPFDATQSLPTAAPTPTPTPIKLQTAETILANQPSDIVERLMETKVMVLQEIREEGSLRGGIVSTYVVFNKPVDQVYELLAQSQRQVEFRTELKSIVTVEIGPDGPVDEQRLRILFQRYVYRLIYRLLPERRRIEWLLDERFDNDLAKVSGFWQLYEMRDGRTLGRSGTSVDVGPAVPAFLQDWITRKNLPHTMKRVRLWVDSDGSYRP